MTPWPDTKISLSARGMLLEHGNATNPVANHMRALMNSLGLSRAGGRTYYALRHTFQTVADETLDFVAVKRIMGHVGTGDISNDYRERVSDERFLRVVNHVRDWLWKPEPPAAEPVPVKTPPADEPTILKIA